ncbi:MAG: RES family NAD+ phosphorylase [Bacteroidales bacterium]|nr:RES family NAD+ phosphorylase [Bacteroidales bacterium]
MEVFRICKEEYSGQIKASGSASRWNVQGHNVIYAGSSRSLSTLELVVRRASIIPILNYKVMVIAVPDDDNIISHIYSSELPQNWRTLAAYSRLQEIGTRWYTTQKSLVLKVPSAIIPYEYNYILNAEHPDFNRSVKLVRVEDYFWDKRLL